MYYGSVGGESILKRNLSLNAWTPDNLSLIHIYADLSVLIAPYLTIGIVIFVMFLIIRFTKMHKNGDQSHGINFGRCV